MKNKIATGIIICVGLGLLSGLVTAPEIKTWYIYLNKPSFNPPNWIFGPVWTLLYTLMGIALGLIWRSNHPNKSQAIKLFVTQFALNLLWSSLFFKWHLLGIAFIEILIMLIFILLTAISYYKINKTAGLLMLPYIAWVSFASILNGCIYFLNK